MHVTGPKQRSTKSTIQVEIVAYVICVGIPNYPEHVMRSGQL